MRFKVDENLPQEVAGILVAAGFDAHTVNDEELSGWDDGKVAQAANI